MTTKTGERNPFFQPQLTTDPKDSFVIHGPFDDHHVLTSFILRNESKTTLAFKLRSTVADLMKVNPPYGFLQPGEKIQVRIAMKVFDDPVKVQRLKRKQHAFIIQFLTYVTNKGMENFLEFWKSLPESRIQTHCLRIEEVERLEKLEAAKNQVFKENEEKPVERSDQSQHSQPAIVKKDAKAAKLEAKARLRLDIDAAKNAANLAKDKDAHNDSIAHDFLNWSEMSCEEYLSGWFPKTGQFGRRLSGKNERPRKLRSKRIFDNCPKTKAILCNGSSSESLDKNDLMAAHCHKATEQLQNDHELKEFEQESEDSLTHHYKEASKKVVDIKERDSITRDLEKLKAEMTKLMESNIRKDSSKAKPQSHHADGRSINWTTIGAITVASLVGFLAGKSLSLK